MSMFSNMTTENLETTEDSLGGGFEPVPSAVYDAVIKNMYVGESTSSKAKKITIIASAGGSEIREDIWFTNGKGENFYISKDEKKARLPLPGFTTIDDICLLVTGHPLSEAATEDKMVKIYNYTEKKDVPTQVPVLIDLIGKPIKLGVLRQIVNKQKKGDDGKYHNVMVEGKPETRAENTINKVFHAETGRTVNEYRHEIETPEFMTAWKERNDGKDKNKVKGGTSNSGSGSSGSGLPGQSSGAGESQAKTSLFGS